MCTHISFEIYLNTLGDGTDEVRGAERYLRRLKRACACVRRRGTMRPSVISKGTVGRVNVCCSACSCYRIKMSSAAEAQLKQADVPQSPPRSSDKACWLILRTTGAKTLIQPTLLSQIIYAYIKGPESMFKSRCRSVPCRPTFFMG